MSTLASLTPDTALKALLNGNVSVQTSATASYILKVYGQGERPNTDLDDEFIEIYNNGVVQSLTRPYGLFTGNLALVIYIRANSDNTAKKNRTRQVLEQVEALVSCKTQDGYFFEFTLDNVITPTTTDISTGYATTVLNIEWHTTYG